MNMINVLSKPVHTKTWATKHYILVVCQFRILSTVIWITQVETAWINIRNNNIVDQNKQLNQNTVKPHRGRRPTSLWAKADGSFRVFSKA